MFIKCLQNNLLFESCPTWVSSKLTDGCLDMAKEKSLYVSPTGGHRTPFQGGWVGKLIGVVRMGNRERAAGKR
jgi:hypothetical protein